MCFCPTMGGGVNIAQKGITEGIKGDGEKKGEGLSLPLLFRLYDNTWESHLTDVISYCLLSVIQ